MKPTNADAQTPHVPHTDKLRVLDLFSGIGGFSLGLERTGGFETVAFCEIEEYPRRVLAKHWPGVPIFEDVRTLTSEQIGPVDVICGGFPCQDISLAGKGAGIEGERSRLWSEFHRLIDELGPRWAIIENVPALRSRGLSTVLQNLSAIGYDAEWHCIPASHVGAPHRRDRIWLVSYPIGSGSQAGAERSRRPAGPDLDRRCARADVANASGGRCRGPERREMEQPGRTTAFSTGENLPDTNKLNAHSGGHGTGPVCGQRPETPQLPGSQGPLADANGDHGYGRRSIVQMGWKRITEEAERNGLSGGTEWRPEPDVGRVAHGVPNRVDRLGALGNAVVPQIPEMIGNAILAAEARPV